jgi:hypothetical protein
MYISNHPTSILTSLCLWTMLMADDLSLLNNHKMSTTPPYFVACTARPSYPLVMYWPRPSWPYGTPWGQVYVLVLYHIYISHPPSSIPTSLHWYHYCKGTSVHFLTSSLLSYTPPVYMYSLSSPLYHLQGLHLQLTTSIPMAQRLPRRRPTGSRRHLSPLTAWTWMALHKSQTHRDRSAWHYGTLRHHVDTHIGEAWW